MPFSKKKSFNPSNIFSQDNYGVLILNGEFKIDPHFFSKVWNRARFRHTVDGGSNIFYKMQQQLQNSDSAILFPHVTSGDFDSIEPDVYEHMSTSSTTTIVPTLDQDETDFTKALSVLLDYTKKNNIKLEHVIAFVENSGRMDQIIANINTLHKSPLKDEIDLYILSSHNLSWLLQPNVENQITFANSDKSVAIDKICGIIPTNGPTRMRSIGLKWELSNEVYNFGGIVSTSNKVVQSNLYVESDVNPVLFTVEMQGDDFVMP